MIAKPFAAVLGLAATCVLQACAARATESPTPVPVAPAAAPTVAVAALPDLAPIAGTAWTLSDLDGKAVAAGERRPTLALDGARAAGFSGCNRWGAEVVGSGPGSWKLGPIAGTRMACEEAEMKLEREFLDALTSSSWWKVEDGRLLLGGPDGKTRLAFTGQPQR